MDYISDSVFSGKVFEVGALLKFGFEKKRDSFFREEDILGGRFCVKIKISGGKKFFASVFDKDLNEPYELHLVPSANGKTAVEVRGEYSALLLKIAELCCGDFVFKTSQAAKTADFLRSEFGAELEFLWKKFPNNAIARRPDNRKWFAAFLTCQKNRLGVDGDEMVEVLNLIAGQSDIEKLVDGKRYFPAFHMNKKNWISIVFDSGVRQSSINSLLKKSFELVLKR